MSRIGASMFVHNPLTESRESLRKFKLKSHSNLESVMDVCRELVESTKDCPPEQRELFKQEMEGFMKVFFAYVKQLGQVLDWSLINPPKEGLVEPYSALPECPEPEKPALLSKLAVLKLNGGLGTTMGCTGPKSAIDVRNDFSFLDLTVLQIEHLNEHHRSNVPLLLMNSFNTHDTTAKILKQYEQHRVTIKTFNQSCYPRIHKESLQPVPSRYDSCKDDWYPPGHGDVFPSLYNSGILDQLIDEGREYLFISNIDNLGATVDFKILQYMKDNNVDFIMEVTDKTRSDIKGGTLIEYEGKAKLLEIAQVPDGKVEEFKSIKKFKIFNTNNLWVRLSAIKEVVEQGKLDEMDIIVNPKKSNDGTPVLQLERAAGAAIQFFENGRGINVPRSRFLPVKNTSDLFVVQSNLYSLKDGTLAMSPKRQFPTVPLVKLGNEFKNVGDYQQRFKGIPDILELDHLTVSGDVTFGSGVSLKGTVIIVANSGMHIDIPDGACLENKIVSGNLHILDH
ncbi:UTP-glucose-1-phosphate uridylyltransferase [Balamuthia mandrillaris]